MHAVSSAWLLAAFFDAQLIRWVVWVGLVVLTVALLLLIRTRWGQSQPLGKCVVLSLLAHLLLGIYTTTVNIVKSTVGSPDGTGIHVALIDPGGAEMTSDAADATWDAVTGEAPADNLHLVPAPALVPPSVPDIQPLREPERQLPDNPLKITKPTPDAPTPDMATMPLLTVRRESIAAHAVAAKEAEPIEDPAVKPEADPVPPPDTPSDAESGKPAAPTDGGGAPDANAPAASLAGPQAPSAAPKVLPTPYQWRVGNHAQIAKGQGATQDTETAVKAALKWLAAHQDPSGRWDSRRLGGGAGRAGDGQDRHAAGSQADVGITALSLLAFLASGNTHGQGSHQPTVRRGLEYLLSVQDASGNLGATSNRYERMYCHAMATCALSEAFAMSGDERLRPAVRRAIDFTIAAQDRVSGGWRYHPGDSGDTSQLGWQVMALKSAELGGFAIPQQTRAGIERFLKSVSLGSDGGLACYQPGRPLVSRSMTAEALACREFLNIRDSHSARIEASGALMQEPPGVGSTNLYYWYYATLALYQLQGDAWQRWNQSLQRTLLSTQRLDGDLAGSWDPDPVWGGCGGRAYGTALSTLCLEVYYRFLPLYVEAAGRDTRTK